MNTSIGEQAVYVDGPAGPLFAIRTVGQPVLRNVVLCSGGWHGGSIRANRMIMRLANAVAFDSSVVRFDWHGSGESPEHIRFFNLAQPFGDDVIAADSLHDDATLPGAVVGFCFGARSALDAAPQLDNLEALVLVSFPLPAGRTKVKRAAQVSARAALREGVRISALRGWFQPATRRVYLKFLELRWQQLKKRLVPKALVAADEGTVRREEAQAIALDDLVVQFRELVRRNIRVLMVFGSDDVMYDHWREAMSGELGAVVTEGAGLIDVAVVDGDLYGFSSLESQDTIIDTTATWLRADPKSGAA